MKVQMFTFNPVQENTYILYDETGECVIIDPGCYQKSEEQKLAQFIESNKLKPVGCWLTHCHFDHIWGTPYVHQQYNLAPKFHADDLRVYNDTPTRLPTFGFPTMKLVPYDSHIIASTAQSGSMKFGNTTLEVLFTPGHSPGHVTFFHKESKQALVGDVIFNGSIGRTDLPGGNLTTLMTTIFQKIIPLGDEVKLYSGHGPITDVKTEKRINPFLK